MSIFALFLRIHGLNKLFHEKKELMNDEVRGRRNQTFRSQILSGSQEKVKNKRKRAKGILDQLYQFIQNKKL